MASLDGGDEGSHKKGPGVKKAKKLSTDVDMTPMVDLGFLLITFFIFTSTMNEPTALDLNMPKDNKDKEKQTEVKESGAINVLIGKDAVFYYEGNLLPDGSNFKSATMAELRDVLIKKKKDVISRYVRDAAGVECENDAIRRGKSPEDCKQKDLFVLIKPTAEASYERVVDVLDEMTINKIARYAMIDPYPTELPYVALSEQAEGASTSK